MTLVPREVHPPSRIHRPPLEYRKGRTRMPEQRKDGWRYLPFGGFSTGAVVELNYDKEIPPWWVTYPQDVPK